MKKSFRLFACLGVLSMLLAGCSTSQEDSKPQRLQITNLNEFAAYLNRGSGEYELMADIDCEGTSITPYNISFSGYIKRLYGNNHKITNFKVIGKENAALIANAEKYEFYDITFDDISIAGTNPAVLVFNAKSCVFQNITIGENVTVGDGSSDYTGGLVAKTSNKTIIKNCVNKATVKGGDYTGGLVGHLYNSSIEGSKNYGNITGYKNKNVGGLAGYVEHYDSSNASASKCTFTGLENFGNVDGKSSEKVGGITGEINRTKHFIDSFDDELSASDLKNHGDVKGKNNVGGIVGEVYDSISTTPFSYCENSGSVIGEEYVGGIVGYNESYEPLASCKNLTNGNKSNYIEGTFFVGGIASRATTVTFSENSMNVRLKKGTAKSDSRIDMNGQYGIGGIIGMTKADKVSKIENCINSGSIEGFEDSKSTKQATSIGGIVGWFTGGSFQNNENTGSVNGSVGCGGLIGSYIPNYDTSFNNCNFTGELYAGSEYCGGLIGYIRGAGSNHKMMTIINCEVDTEDMYAYGSNFGGLIGYASVGTNTQSNFETIKIFDSSISGTIHYKTAAQTLVGYNELHSSSGKYCVVIDSSVTSSVNLVAE